MKTSKFFFSTLIAASAMTATAYADYTWDRTQDYSFAWDFSQTNTQNGQTGVLGGTVTNTFATENIVEIGTVIKEGNADGSYWEVNTNSFFYDSLQEVTSATEGTGTLTFSVDYYWTGAQWGENILHIGCNGTGVALGLSNGYISFATGTATDNQFAAAKTNLCLDANAWNTITWTLTGDSWSVSNGVDTVSGGEIADIIWDASEAERNKYSIGVKAPGWNSGATGLNDSGCKLANLSVAYTGDESLDLVWAGGADGGIWDGSTASWEGGSVFAYGDSVTFNTADATVTVSGTVAPGTVTISENTTFTGTDWTINANTLNVSADISLDGNGVIVADKVSVSENATLDGAGTIEVSNSGLSLADGVSLTLGKDVVLDLGLEGLGTLNKNIIGEGTIVWGNSAGSHGTTIALSDNFEGTLSLSGYIGAGAALSLGGTKKLVLDGVWCWSGGGAIASANLQVLEIIGGTNRLEGSVTTGTLNISGGTTNISGSVSADKLLVSGGTVTVTNTNKKLSTGVVVSGGELVLNGGGQSGALTGSLTVNEGGLVRLTANDATGYHETDASSRIDSLMVGEGGELRIETNSNTGTNQTFNMSEGITLKGGKISGTNESGYSKFDLFGSTSGITTLASDITAEISASVGLRNSGKFEVAKGTTADGVDLHISGMLTSWSGVVKDTTEHFTAAFTKAGEGTLKLSGDNQYWTTGGTVSEGTLVAAHQNALGSGNVTVKSDATLKLAVAVENVGNVSLEEGAMFAIDVTGMSPVSMMANGNETVALSILSSSALSFNGQDASSLSSDTIDGYFDDKNSNLGQWSEWQREWSYQNGALNLTLTIPEPSAFGLLAGVGALALVASRRRRSRR